MTRSGSETAAALRRRLARLAETAGRERRTAALVARRLRAAGGWTVSDGVGGHGVLAVRAGPRPGPTVLLRAELDALPAPGGAAHLCGHDGHLAALLAAATRLARRPPPRGRVALLFQPAEETGAGAARVRRDRRYRELAPDWAFALHNLPGPPLGTVLTRPGAFACGSAGCRVRLRGRAAHAGEPERGLSPARAAARLVLRLEGLSRPDGTGGGAGATKAGPLRLVTVVGARIGRGAFGSAPADAEVRATLRSDDVAELARLRRRAEALARSAGREGLEVSLSWHDVFPPLRNDPAAAALAVRAARAAGLPVRRLRAPYRWSEDFGRLAGGGEGESGGEAGDGAVPRLAMVALGAGPGRPPLHARDYEFPDALLGPATRLLERLAREALRT